MRKTPLTQPEIVARRLCAGWTPKKVAEVVGNGKSIAEFIATDRAVLPAADCAYVLLHDSVMSRGERIRLARLYLRERKRQRAVKPKWMSGRAWAELTPAQARTHVDAGTLDGDTALALAVARDEDALWRYGDHETILRLLADVVDGRRSLEEGGK